MKKISPKFFSQSLKSGNKKSTSNYYLDFHKENALNHAAMSLDNLLSNSVRDDDYFLPEPKMKFEKKFFADTYINQVLAIVINRNLLFNPNLMAEAKAKAMQYLNIKGFNVGAYSDSKGIFKVRKNMAEWYAKRDEGYKISEDDIYLTNGGMNSYDHIISTICDVGDVVITPNPAYPFYSAYNQSCGVENLFYTFEGIEEGNPEKINYKKLTEEIEEQKRKGKHIKAMTVVNPNDPLGTMMSEEEMEELIRFCEKYNLPLIAIETLQSCVFPKVKAGNVIATHSSQNLQVEQPVIIRDLEGNEIETEKDKKFRSFRYMVQKLNSQLELFSMFSISKGPFFHRGIRGGVLDCLNIDEDVLKQLYKYKSIDLCSNVPGQICIDLCLNKPQEFGYEFLYNYEQSLNDYYKSQYEAKSQIYEEIQKDNEIFPRDIEAGTSFFVKTKSPKKNLEIGKVSIRSKPGSYYGKENYVNFYIDSTLF